MKGVAAAFLGAFVVACSGCGGGGGGGNSVPAAAAQVQPKPVMIDVGGDSLLWGYLGTAANGQYIQSANNPPVIIQADLQAQFGSTVTVANNAKPGSQAYADLIGAAPYYTSPLATRLAATSAQIALADYAVNDSHIRTPDQYTQDLTDWIATVRQAGKTPILEEPNPVCDPSIPNVLQYVNLMRQVAQQQNVQLIAQYDYIAALPNWQSMLVDCIHPNDALYKIKGDREAAALAPIVKSISTEN